MAEDKENEKKQILLRVSPSLWQKLSIWAEEDFRSINGQIESILSDAVRTKYKLPLSNTADKIDKNEN